MPSKPIGRAALCLLSCLACIAHAQEPETVDEIIARYVEAIGGRAALDACKTIRSSAKATLSNGAERFYC